MAKRKHVEAKPQRCTSALDTQHGGSHYQFMGDYQPHKVLHAQMSPEEYKGFCKGTAEVYLMREARKGGRLDIQKALHTLAIYLELTEGERL